MGRRSTVYSFVKKFYYCDDNDDLPDFAMVVFAMSSEDCSRYVDSGQHQSGTFSSPNYPRDYPSDVVCQYTFQAHARQRVQITFTDFLLRHLLTDDPAVRRSGKLVVFSTVNVIDGIKKFRLRKVRFMKHNI